MIVRVKRKYIVTGIVLLSVSSLYYLFNMVAFGEIKSPLKLLPVDRFTTSLTCNGPNEKVVHLGFRGNPSCVTTYPDGGKLCTNGNDCISGKCVISYDAYSKLELKKITDERVSFENQYEVYNVPKDSGTCEIDEIPLCFKSRYVLDKNNILTVPNAICD